MIGCTTTSRCSTKNICYVPPVSQSHGDGAREPHYLTSRASWEGCQLLLKSIEGRLGVGECLGRLHDGLVVVLDCSRAGESLTVPVKPPSSGSLHHSVSLASVLSAVWRFEVSSVTAVAC